jgi:hypothetical protein
MAVKGQMHLNPTFYKESAFTIYRKHSCTANAVGSLNSPSGRIKIIILLMPLSSMEKSSWEFNFLDCRETLTGI